MSLEIEIADIVPVQADALIGEEVRRGPEDLLRAVVGDDPDQGPVDVEGERSDVHDGPLYGLLADST